MKKNKIEFSLLLLIAFSLALFNSCKEKASNTTVEVTENTKIEYAKGFSISKSGNVTIIKVTNPWPSAESAFTYALVPKNTKPPKGNFDAIVEVPIQTLVATSTTHIPALEALGVETKLKGFPGTAYVSSSKTRKLIDNGNIAELGANESINTEMLLNLDPDVVIGFSIDSRNKTYQTIERAGIPVVYNGDWVEETPLGKAEWIKFFAPFFGKEKEADNLFNEIAYQYNEAKQLAASSEDTPTVVAGAMYKDVWYLPGGKSWMAEFLKDANGEYLWKDDTATGSLSLSFETVYDKAINADYWIGPGQFISYEQLIRDSERYKDFKAFKNKNIFTFSKTTGATGGLLYYELAPSRPDLVLKDMIYLLHPGVLSNYQPYFFKPLD